MDTAQPHHLHNSYVFVTQLTHYDIAKECFNGEVIEIKRKKGIHHWIPQCLLCLTQWKETKYALDVCAIPVIMSSEASRIFPVAFWPNVLEK